MHFVNVVDMKWEYGYISALEQLLKNLKALFQFLKMFQFLLRSWEIAIFSFIVISSNSENGYNSVPEPKFTKQRALWSLKLQTLKKIKYFYIFAQGLRYSHFLILCQPQHQGAILEFRKPLYLNPLSKNWQNKENLVLSNFKSWRK